MKFFQVAKFIFDGFATRTPLTNGMEHQTIEPDITAHIATLRKNLKKFDEVKQTQKIYSRINFLNKNKEIFKKIIQQKM